MPIQGDTVLKTGDEIRLSSKGPLMGFIIPQGKQSLVSSIGMTERLSLFRQQALRPYKRAIWTLAILLILAIAGLVTWNILQAKKFDKELQSKQEQIIQVQDELNASGEQIEALNQELIEAKDKSEAEQAAVQKKLRDAQARQRELVNAAEKLNKDMKDALDQAAKAGKDAVEAQAQADALQKQVEEIKDKPLFQREEEKSEGLFGKKK
jgi:myosin heavy subunit